MSWSEGELRARAHLNLVESSRRLFEFDPGAKIERGESWQFGAGRSSHPAISNAGFRKNDALDPDLLVQRARTFFGEQGRGFSLWVRDGAPEDRDFIATAKSAGLKEVHAAPEMVLRRRAEEAPLPAGIELRRVTGTDEGTHFWRVAASAYATNGFPPEVFSYYEDDGAFLAEDVAAFVAYRDGEPVSIAMTIVSHGVAGVYWVGTVEDARGLGLGRALTAAATNAGFDLGAEVASLQASPMGEPVYRAMGYEAIFTYRLLLQPPP